jgi:hypothetical protein
MKSDNSKGKIADSTESENRVNRAIDFLLNENMSRGEWVIYCKKEYNIESRQSDVYWKKAKDHIKDKFTKEREALAESHHARLFALYVKALKDGDMEIARKVLADIAKLTGVNEPDKKDVTSEGERIQINIGIEPDEDNEE